MYTFTLTYMLKKRPAVHVKVTLPATIHQIRSDTDKNDEARVFAIHANADRPLPRRQICTLIDHY